MLAHLRLAFAAAALAGAMAATPALAQSGAYYPGHPEGYYYPNQGSYSVRQGPDGTYDSLADFIGDLRGRAARHSTSAAKSSASTRRSIRLRAASLASLSIFRPIR